MEDLNEKFVEAMLKERPVLYRMPEEDIIERIKRLKEKHDYLDI